MDTTNIKVGLDSSQAKAGPPRDKWANKAEFLLSCIGLSVGIGNVWRFPYLAYQNGGGAFLLAYVILLFLVGKPLYFMELAIGQFAGTSAFRVWRCYPIAQGVGAAMMIMSVVVGIYYTVIMTYTLYYIGQSFRSTLPWSDCYDWWGADDSCYVRQSNQTACRDVARNLVKLHSPSHNASLDDVAERFVNVSWEGETAFISENLYNESFSTCYSGIQTASEQFWERYVLRLTDGIEEVGSLKWDLTLTLAVCWTVVFLGLMKGIRSTGKVVYFTATFPYLILITLVIYGFTLPGALGGLQYFFVPEWKKLLRIEVWRAAAEQLLFSLSIGWGSLIMYSSYNDFHNRLYRDAMFVSALDFLTSLLSGIAIFSILGNMSYEMGIEIASVAKGGQGLAFVTYPEAVARLPLPQLWSVMFFFMLFLLAIDSEFSYLENFFTFLFDEYPNLVRWKSSVTFVFCFLFLLLGLPCVTEGGQYVLNLMDRFGGGYAGLFVSTFEIIMVMWGYGAKRFSDDLEFMLGFRPGLYWQICWKYISPVVLLFVVIYGMCALEPIDYGGVPYPSWAQGLGWGLMLISVVQIPLWIVIQLIRHRKDPRKVLRPHPSWGPSDPDLRRIYRMKNFDDEEESCAKNGIINMGMDPVHLHEK